MNPLIAKVNDLINLANDARATARAEERSGHTPEAGRADEAAYTRFIQAAIELKLELIE